MGVNLQELTPVYAVIVVILYSWSLIHFFWKLPSWLDFLSAGEISVVLAYMIVINAIESILVLLAVLVARWVFFWAWPDGQFIVKGVVLVVAGLGFLMLRNHYFPTKALYALTLTHWLSLSGAAILIILFPFGRIPLFQRAVASLADRFVVFLYISMPATVLAILIVVLRNLS
jgi:hypothetical protein